MRLIRSTEFIDAESAEDLFVRPFIASETICGLP